MESIPEFLQKEETIGATEDTLQRLQESLSVRSALLERIEQVKEELVNLEKDFDKVDSLDIPGILDSVGLSRIRLSTGEEVTIKKEVYASVAKEKRDALYAWLKERGDESIMKKKMVVSEPSQSLIDDLFKRGTMFNVDRSIHGQTLKSYVKGLLEKGETPPKCISYFQKNKTVVK